MIVIEARGLVKRYGALTAVDHISFAVEEGEGFGFLGPNGAGKTTTLRTIYGFSPVTAGELRVLGLDVGTHARRIKALVGVVPQENNLDPDLTVLENLLVYARYFDLPAQVARPRALEALELFQLLDRRDSRVEQLSTGMKRRLIIARALIHQPKILILDEPTAGLDPQARHLVWQKLRHLKAHGATMLLTTHYMEEAAQLCDRLVIMDRGRILAEGSPHALVANYVGREVLELRLTGPKDAARAQLAGRDLTVEEVGDTLYLFGRDRHSLEGLPQRLAEAGQGFVYRPATLEDVFLKLTGRELRE